MFININITKVKTSTTFLTPGLKEYLILVSSDESLLVLDLLIMDNSIPEAETEIINKSADKTAGSVKPPVDIDIVFS